MQLCYLNITITKKKKKKKKTNKYTGTYNFRKIICILPENGSTKAKHVAIKERHPIKDNI
jgi:hypothetical protein